MKKNVMALSIAAMIGGLGFAGVASADVIVGAGGNPAAVGDIVAGKMAVSNANALAVTTGGIGHAMVVPYYNAQNGNMTVLHVVNTDQANGKVVKVRFRTASNSDDVLDFQVFLSPGDVWTAAVTADANGLAQLSTGDNTCTVPAIGGAGQPFNNADRLPGYLSVDQRNAMTREGYVEIFNVADITNLKTWDNTGTAVAGGTLNSPLYTAVKHVAGTPPCSVAGSASRSLLNTLAGSDFSGALGEAAAAKAGLQTPTGGLTGDWYVINVPQTTVFSGADTVIQAQTGAALNGTGNFTMFAQLGNALVAAAGANGVTADPLFRSNAGADNVRDAKGAVFAGPALSMLNYDAPDLSTPMLNGGTALTQASTLLTALSTKSVTNQYANDPTISAKTDWVFSMPARRYNVTANYSAVTGTSGATGPTSANAAYRLFTDLGAPNDQTGDWFYTAVNATLPAYAAGAGFKTGGNTTVDANGNICVYADGQKFYDREETSQVSGPVFSPGTATSVSFCGEVSVMAFADTGNSSLSASVARSTVTSGTYMNGWGVINTTNAGQGLPLVGYSAIKLTNPNVGAGVSGTYGITWPHRYSK